MAMVQEIVVRAGLLCFVFGRDTESPTPCTVACSPCLCGLTVPDALAKYLPSSTVLATCLLPELPIYHFRSLLRKHSKHHLLLGCYISQTCTILGSVDKE